MLEDRVARFDTLGADLLISFLSCWLLGAEVRFLQVLGNLRALFSTRAPLSFPRFGAGERISQSESLDPEEEQSSRSWGMRKEGGVYASSVFLSFVRSYEAPCADWSGWLPRRAI